MNVYECIAIIDATLSDEATEEAVAKISSTMNAGGAEILKTDVWGRRKMAYEINKHERGFYVLFVYKAPSALNKTLEEFFKVYDPIFKYMLIRLEGKQAAHAVAEAAKAVAKPTEETAEQAENAAEAVAAGDASVTEEA